MLIRNAEIAPGVCVDVRVSGDRVIAIGDLKSVRGAKREVDACGRALIPGLHDHHLHFLAFAASLDSVECGPPSVCDQDGLVRALQGHKPASPQSWIRGVGYHHSVAGEIDRDWLDLVMPNVPVRIQERSGRLWIFNSAAIEILAPEGAASPLEMAGGRHTGRLLDGDVWLRERLGRTLPPIRAASEMLLSRGVTGFTDTTPTNGVSEYMLLKDATATGVVAQSIFLMGNGELDELPDSSAISIGPRKIHLHEADLPAPGMPAVIAETHRIGRRVAVHCVTLAELVVALAAFDEAGTLPGDRIEHAAVAPPELMPTIARLGLTIVTQPNFVSERGDIYLTDVEPFDRPWLYRLRGFLDAAIPLAAGTDAPFGNADPWRAIQAAVTRRTARGAELGAAESLSPMEAFSLFRGEPKDPGGPPRSVRVGAAADLCLIDRPWADACADFQRVRVAVTIKNGRIVWSN
jgi:predicted amidohydrolase YtcJ